MRFRSCLTLLGLASLACAAPPELTSVYPAGLARGTSADLTLTGTFGAWPVHVWTSNPSITGVATRERGRITVQAKGDVDPGVYWLRVYDPEGASNLRPICVGRLPEALEAEPNDELAKAQAVPASSVVNGRLDKTQDVDTYAVDLKKGETLVAQFEAHKNLRSPMDGVLQILSADGFVVTQNNDWHGLDPLVTHTAATAGKYFVRVFAFAAEPNGSIRLSSGAAYIYRLTLTTGGFAEAALPLAVARSASAKVRPFGWNIPPEARDLSVRDVGEFGVADHDRLSGPVRVRVEGHECWNLTLPDRLAPKQFSAPFSATARFDRSGEVGRFPVMLKKGQGVTIRAESQAHGLAVHPLLRVVDPMGKVGARAEPPAINEDCELNYIPPTDGLHVVEVRDEHLGHGPRFIYLLRVLIPTPTFELTTTKDRWGMTPGAALDIPIQVQRKNGFAESVDLVVEGLPPHVSATVVPAKKGDESNLLVRLTATRPEPVQSAFRIVGRSKKGANLGAVAWVPLPELAALTSDLWLTVAPASPKK